MLTKVNSTNFNTQWVNPPAAATKPYWAVVSPTGTVTSKSTLPNGASGITAKYGTTLDPYPNAYDVTFGSSVLGYTFQVTQNGTVADYNKPVMFTSYPVSGTQTEVIVYAWTFTVAGSTVSYAQVPRGFTITAFAP
jgi:hypothetical protein